MGSAYSSLPVYPTVCRESEDEDKRVSSCALGSGCPDGSRNAGDLLKANLPGKEEGKKDKGVAGKAFRPHAKMRPGEVGVQVRALALRASDCSLDEVSASVTVCSCTTSHTRVWCPHCARAGLQGWPR